MVLGISIPNKDGDGMVPFRRLGLVGLGRQHSSVWIAYPCPGLYSLDEEEELVGDGNNDSRVSNKMLREMLWTWTEDLLYVLCTTGGGRGAPSEERSLCSGRIGAGGAGQTADLVHTPDRVKESIPTSMHIRMRAPILSEAK